ncbi:sugar-transfer associated ATP-grasp domain-containing protein [Microbacterium sp. 179-B 1A2 NHS]|uniref:sugar-transfer associated ATP-grasp domain-containing protein n=1 Tax=Microbacterium sp. 179-B 1A2 NHS TaxID=3142383 RepID=UPI0039A3AB04
MGAVHRLYRRARFFVKRVVNFDRDRVLQFARQSARLSTAPLGWVVLDMLWCSVRYETTFENYSEWDFRILRPRERKTYMTDPKSFHLSRRLNDDSRRAVFDDKLQFAERFGDELGREWIDLRQTDAAAFGAFVSRHPRIIAKNPGGVGGNGISLLDSADIDDPAATRDELITAGQVLVEEVLVQHPDMASLYPRSVNSLRVVSYLDPDGEVHVLAGVLKIGNGGVIDNFSNGGMYTMLDERGRALHAASDEEGRPFAEHPVTGVTITGFQVPLYDEVLALVDRLARTVPAMPYIGWDVAITASGPVVIEGNHNTGVFQSKPSVSGIRSGLLPRYRAAMRF